MFQDLNEHPKNKGNSSNEGSSCGDSRVGDSEEDIALEKGTSAGQIMRIRQTLHRVTFQRDSALYRAREVEREVERLATKVKEGTKVLKAYDELKKDHDDMLNSLRASESQCFKQKSLIEYMRKEQQVTEQVIKYNKKRKASKLKKKKDGLSEDPTALRRHSSSPRLPSQTAKASPTVKKKTPQKLLISARSTNTAQSGKKSFARRQSLGAHLILSMEKEQQIVNEQKRKKKEQRKTMKVKIKNQAVSVSKEMKNERNRSVLHSSPRSKTRGAILNTHLSKKPSSRTTTDNLSQKTRKKKKIGAKSSTTPGYLKNTRSAAQRNKEIQGVQHKGW